MRSGPTSSTTPQVWMCVSRKCACVFQHWGFRPWQCCLRDTYLELIFFSPLVLSVSILPAQQEPLQRHPAPLRDAQTVLYQLDSSLSQDLLFIRCITNGNRFFLCLFFIYHVLSLPFISNLFFSKMYARYLNHQMCSLWLFLIFMDVSTRPTVLISLAFHGYSLWKCVHVAFYSLYLC